MSRLDARLRALEQRHMRDDNAGLCAAGREQLAIKLLGPDAAAIMAAHADVALTEDEEAYVAELVAATRARAAETRARMTAKRPR